MRDGEAFGFVDPSQVLRGCHIISRFTKGLLHSDGNGLSHYAGDALDSRQYYVNRFVTSFVQMSFICQLSFTNRFVDCDMVMRYFWGLAVGHTDTRGRASATGTSCSDLDAAAAITESYELEESSEQLSPLVYGDPGNIEHASACDNNPEFGLDDCEGDDWTELNSGNEDEGDHDEIDEDTLMDLHEMYGDSLYMTAMIE
jgi:hypothetical protein